MKQVKTSSSNDDEEEIDQDFHIPLPNKTNMKKIEETLTLFSAYEKKISILNNFSNKDLKILYLIKLYK